jgi:RimJ/RimL family protein N-acetyltransferase
LPLTAEHLESFHACLDAVARERQWIGLVQAPPLESTRQHVLASLDKGNIHFLALDTGKVVGWCDITRLEREGSRHCGRLGIGLLPGYRGRGAGRRLMESAISRALEVGLERVELEVYASNATAIGLYEKLGFVREGAKRKGRFLDGRYEDVILMALFLPTPAG